ncbi:hypothetical protein [Paenibacillus kobensis]|uniref:hypothetical protein n=1 Tax=Paenibacillus kobensis TaxID=59841 RepID=UPI000FDC4D93|nr:hypothetical protein [Paenibacillus kobensis]
MMKKLVVRAGMLVMIMSVIFAGSAFAAYESESNDFYNQANTLSNVPFGQTGEAMFGTFREGGDIDWYSFNTPQNGLQQVLVVPPSGQTVTYAIYDAALYTPGSSVGHILSKVNVSGFDVSNFYVQAGHSYYLFIYGSSSGSNQYMISLSYQT